jgi:hypothetical protein
VSDGLHVVVVKGGPGGASHEGSSELEIHLSKQLVEWHRIAGSAFHWSVETIANDQLPTVALRNSLVLVSERIPTVLVPGKVRELADDDLDHHLDRERDRHRARETEARRRRRGMRR